MTLFLWWLFLFFCIYLRMNLWPDKIHSKFIIIFKMEPLTIKCSAFQMITPANSPTKLYMFCWWILKNSMQFPKINTEESLKNDVIENFGCGHCGAIFIEMHHWKEHIQLSNKDLLKNINCNIGFIRIATEVEELIRPEGGKSNELTMNILKRTKSIFHHCAQLVENKVETIDRENGISFNQWKDTQLTIRRKIRIYNKIVLSQMS